MERLHKKSHIHPPLVREVTEIYSLWRRKSPPIKFAQSISAAFKGLPHLLKGLPSPFLDGQTCSERPVNLDSHAPFVYRHWYVIKLRVHTDS